MSSVIKLQAPFERLKLATGCPEVALCRAIILQAIVDASSPEPSQEAEVCTREAIEWLFNDSRHLEEICMGAELEVGFVREVAEKMITFNRDKKSFPKK